MISALEEHNLWRSGELAALPNEIRQMRDAGLAWNTEPGAEVIPEAEAELGTGPG